MRKTIAIALFAAGAAALSMHALAKGPGGGGGGAHGPASQAAPSQAPANANAPWTGTQEKGLDQAQERRSTEGNSHEKATSNQERRDSKPQGGRAPR